MIVPVLSKRRFDFGYLAGATTQSVVLQPALDVGAYYYVQLWVRVHERSMTSGQSLDLSLYNTLPDDLDPREFTGDEFFAVSLTSSAPPSAPGLLYRESYSPGLFLKLVLTATQTSSIQPFYAELSAVVGLRAA